MSTTNGASTLLSYLQDNESSIACSICKKPYTNPRQLPCCHIYCNSCLTKIPAKDGFLSCPSCYQSHAIPAADSGGTGEWPVSVFCESVLRSAQLFTKDGVMCSCCDEHKNAAVACFSCGEVLCSSCRDAHKRFKVTRDHTVCPISDLSEASNIKQFQKRQYDLCETHRSEMNKYYCEDDQIKICGLCVHEDPHREHTTISLTAKVGLVTTALAGVFEMATSQHQEVLSSIHAIEEKMKAGDETREKELQRIDESSKTLHQLIDNFVNAQRSEIMSQSKSQSTELADLLVLYRTDRNRRQDLLTKAGVVEELAISDIIQAGTDIMVPLDEMAAPPTLNEETLYGNFPAVKFVPTSLDEKRVKDCLRSLLGFVTKPPHSEPSEITVLSCLMPEKMKEGAILATNQALTLHATMSRDVASYNQISKYIKEYFDARFKVRGKVWQCVVGTREQFGWYVSRHGDNSISLLVNEMAIDLFILK